MPVARCDRVLAGWRVRCEFPIPELLPWSAKGAAGGDRAPDLFIRLGQVPDRLEDVVSDGPLLQVARDGWCRFALKNLAAYFISSSGDEVIVSPAPGAAESDIRLFLLGTVFGILCHKRNLLPLHASCVEIDGRAIAFAGPPAAGKSTLAAAFVKAGYRLLADDVTVVDVTAPGGPAVVPSLPGLKLWREAMTGLGFDMQDAKRTRAELEKYHLPTQQTFTPEPLPLAAIYHLQSALSSKLESITRLTGAGAVKGTGEAIYRPNAGRNLIGRQQLLQAVLRLCTAVPCHTLTGQVEFQHLPLRIAGLLSRHTNSE
jgi:hypothetical protein